MTVNPVFLNELRQSAFRRRGSLVTVSLMVAGILFATLAQMNSLRTLVVSVPIILLPLLVPAIASGAFAKEYEQQTWLDLTLTRLTNAQVVWGKFGAYFLQVSAALLVLMPAVLLMLLGDYSARLSDLRFDVVPLRWQFTAVATTFVFFIKLLISACVYVFLTMICSRYSPDRRTAITWSYIAMALYTGLGVLLWTLIGSLDYRNQMSDQDRAAALSHGNAPIEITFPGFMEKFHFLFCAVMGIGSFVLLWVSLSEARGYREGTDGQSVSRGWQPMARHTRERTT